MCLCVWQVDCGWVGLSKCNIPSSTPTHTERRQSYWTSPPPNQYTTPTIPRGVGVGKQPCWTLPQQMIVLRSKQLLTFTHKPAPWIDWLDYFLPFLLLFPSSSHCVSFEGNHSCNHIFSYCNHDECPYLNFDQNNNIFYST